MFSPTSWLFELDRRAYAISLRTNVIAASNHQSLNWNRYDHGLQTGLGVIREEGVRVHHALGLTERNHPNPDTPEVQLKY